MLKEKGKILYKKIESEAFNSKYFDLLHNLESNSCLPMWRLIVKEVIVIE